MVPVYVSHNFLLLLKLVLDIHKKSFWEFNLNFVFFLITSTTNYFEPRVKFRILFIENYKKKL